MAIYKSNSERRKPGLAIGLFPPVQDLAALSSQVVDSGNDKWLMLVENNGLFMYDSEGAFGAPDGINIIPANGGRGTWNKINQQYTPGIGLVLNNDVFAVNPRDQHPVVMGSTDNVQIVGGLDGSHEPGALTAGGGYASMNCIASSLICTSGGFAIESPNLLGSSTVWTGLYLGRPSSQNSGIAQSTHDYDITVGSDNGNFGGIIYAADYSNNFSNLSLVNKGYVSTLIANATAGIGMGLFPPVPDLAALSSQPVDQAHDNWIMLVENNGLFRYDVDGATFNVNGTTVIAAAGGTGTWTKITATITDHNLLTNIAGGGITRAGRGGSYMEYLHLSRADYNKVVALPGITGAGLGITFGSGLINVDLRTYNVGTGTPIIFTNGNAEFRVNTKTFGGGPGFYMSMDGRSGLFLIGQDAGYNQFNGIQYAADYSANFLPLSLVNKAYVDAKLQPNYRKITTDYTVVPGDRFIECNGTLTLTFYRAAGNQGKEINIKNVGSGTVTLMPIPGESIELAASQSLSTPMQYARYVSNNLGWLQFS